MKIATWNVNGIRARHDAGARSDRARAARRALPAGDQGDARAGSRDALRSSPATGATGTAPAPTRASACSCARSAAGEPPRFAHPAFDHETRIAEVERRRRRRWRRSTCRTAARTSPPRWRSSRRWRATSRASTRAGGALVLCGDLNIARERARRAPEGAQAERDRPASRGARAVRRDCSAHGLVDVGRALDPDNDALFTWWAPWRNLRQRNIGWRLDYVLASDAVARSASSCVSPPRVRHQRSRAGGGDLRRRVVDGPTHGPAIGDERPAILRAPRLAAVALL